MREVTVGSVPIDRLASLLEPERARRLAEQAAQARELLQGRVVWNVNATATGGGVAEMLQALLDYAHGAGVDTRWLVLTGTPDFFRLTKRLHNLLHGSPGDGGPLGDEERRVYDDMLATNAAALHKWVSPGDIVLLHDPQTAGLVSDLAEADVHAVWRCHVGRDTSNEQTDLAWDFLRPYVEKAEASIYSRAEYAPEWVDRDRLWVIPPSLDPFSAKNRDLTDAEVDAALRQAGIMDLPSDGGSLKFVRRDGSSGTLRHHEGMMVSGGPLPGDARYVLQVSRWDRLKDMAGVMKGFADVVDDLPEDVHLVLAGPEVAGVSDDPEGAEILEECLALWRDQPEATQRRLHLCSVPMDDTDENAHIINALQQRASVVVQKSLVEGFGLTVTEPMWKARPVVASRIGGIQDQIQHGENGLLLDDPYDLESFGRILVELLADPDRAQQIGTAARERVRDRFLGDRHLPQYVDLFARLLERD